MTREDLENMPTSELLEFLFSIIKERAEKIIYYTNPCDISGYDDDILSIYFILKVGGYHD